MTAMPARTLAALKASIMHWTENVQAETPDQTRLGQDHCALCQAFPRVDCMGCPVMKKTGQPGCDGSPYIDVMDAHAWWEDAPDSPEARAEWVTAATAERDFLVSLLPEGETP